MSTKNGGSFAYCPCHADTKCVLSMTEKEEDIAHAADSIDFDFNSHVGCLLRLSASFFLINSLNLTGKVSPTQTYSNPISSNSRWGRIVVPLNRFLKVSIW